MLADQLAQVQGQGLSFSPVLVCVGVLDQG